MFRYVRRFVAPPAFEDEEQSRVASLLYPVSLTVALFCLITAVIAISLHHIEISCAAATILMGAIGSVLLARRHRLKLAAIVLLLAALAGFDYLIYIADGIHDVAIFAFPALIFIGGLLLQKQAYTAYVLLIAISLSAVVLGEATGVIESRFSQFTSPFDMLYLLLILFSMAALARLISGRIVSYVEDIRSARVDLDMSVRELQRSNLELGREIADRVLLQNEREELIVELQQAVGEVTALGGLLPICASCKKIRDDQGYWHQVEVYIQNHSKADFSHGICPECERTLYPEIQRDDT